MDYSLGESEFFDGKLGTNFTKKRNLGGSMGNLALNNISLVRHGAIFANFPIRAKYTLILSFLAINIEL